MWYFVIGLTNFCLLHALVQDMVSCFIPMGQDIDEMEMPLELFWDNNLSYNSHMLHTIISWGKRCVWFVVLKFLDTSLIVEFIDITFTPLIQFLLEEILEYYFCATIYVTILIFLRWRQNDKTSVVIHLVEGVEKWEDRKYFSYLSCCLICVEK